MSLVSKRPAPPPKKALSSLLPRKTAPVRKKPPPPRCQSYEKVPKPPPPVKSINKAKLANIPKPKSISASLPPPPRRKDKELLERDRTDTVQAPANMPELESLPPAGPKTRPRNKKGIRPHLEDPTRTHQSTSVLPPGLVGISQPPSAVPSSLTARVHYNSAPPVLNSKASKLDAALKKPIVSTRKRGPPPKIKANRSSTILPHEVGGPTPPPEKPTSFSNSPIASKRTNEPSSASSSELMDKMMDFTTSNDFDIYSEDPSVGLPGSSSFLEEEVKAAMDSDASFSREVTSDSGELPQLNNFRSYSPPPPTVDDKEMMRASTVPTSPSISPEEAALLKYVPRSASMDGLKPALKNEYSKRSTDGLTVQFAKIDDFIGEEDSDDLGDIPDLPGSPPRGPDSGSDPMSAPPMASGPPPPSTGALPFGLPPKISGPPRGFPPKPTSTALPSFLPPKPPRVVDDLSVESHQEKDTDALRNELGSPPSTMSVALSPPGGSPTGIPAGLKKLPPKINTNARTPPDTAPSPVASNTRVVDGDVQIDNKYLFLGSPRLSAKSDGRLMREIRRMSDSQAGLAVMAGGLPANSVTKKAKGFFEAKAKQLKASSIPRKKKKLEAGGVPAVNPGNIPIGTRRGIYIRGESGWVKINSKQGKEIANSPEGVMSSRPALRKSISLTEVRQQSSVSSKKALFEQKANKKKKEGRMSAISPGNKVKRPPKKHHKRSGYIKNARGKWVAPGEKADGI